MTNRIRIAAASLAFAAIGASATIAGAQEELRFRIGSGHPIGLLAYTQVAHDFYAPELKRRIEEQTDHTVVAQELHASAVAGVTEVFGATRDGLLDIGFWGNIFEPTHAFNQAFTLYLPFNTPDPVQMTQAIRETVKAHPELVDFTAHNQKVVATGCVENYGLGTTFAWKDFDELSGRRIAGAGANLNWIAGATPVTSNLNEAYQAMQTGVYDGYISASMWWTTFKLNEVAPHYTRADFGSQWIIFVTMNLDTWNNLDPEVQQIILDLGVEYEDRMAEECAKFNELGLDRLREAGATVTEIDPEAKTEWCEEIADFPRRMAEDGASRGLNTGEVMATYVAALGDLGYEFPCELQLE